MRCLLSRFHLSRPENVLFEQENEPEGGTGGTGPGPLLSDLYFEKTGSEEENCREGLLLLQSGMSEKIFREFMMLANLSTPTSKNTYFAPLKYTISPMYRSYPI
jgi:hypothetical protein